MFKNKKIQFLKFALFLGLFVFSFFGARTVNAATIYFSPSSGNFSVGNILTMSVLVNTQSKAINNSNAIINFPAGLLEVVSISKSGSIFSLWVEEPSFSNSAGTISFDGGLPTPGFNGTAGKIVNIVFRIRNAGTASLVFSSAAVRANDGYGTDILQTKANAQFNLISEERPIAPPPVTLGTPQAPSISSPTHSDSNKWYSNNSPKFMWDVPSGITGVRLLVGRLPTATPTILYTEPISERQLEDFADGVWYFHAQFKNEAGWGGIAHFRFQIDTEKPSRFELTEIPRKDITEPKTKFIFDAKDETSGIDHYKVQIDAGSSQVWQDDGSHKYETPVLEPGKHTLIAKAVDKAGNSLANSVEFTIEALKPPTITEYPKELQSGEILKVEGNTYLNSKVVLWLQREKEDAQSYSIESDKNGNFTFIADEKSKDGIYKLWAEAIDDRGARSEPSDKLTIIVQRLAILEIATRATIFLIIIIPLIALLIILLMLVWYLWHKFITMRNRLQKEVREAEQALHKAFDLLKEDIREHIKMLEKAQTKRRLTEEEEKIIKQLKKDLDDAEKFVRKEIEDIEKEVK
ncbi:MAG: hypothetical protein HYT28_02390 [Parcubacteria group bacterium]|nr:hypothetical protein [Parcubacteria group bacterium]